MEVFPGQIEYNSKNDMGQIMTPQACEHMAEFRIRCSFCEQNFCCNCGERPYHTGMTCEQFKRYKESQKCRFCGDVIFEMEEVKYEEGEGPGAFADVCKKNECQELVKDCCDKTLPCGHICHGFRGEKHCLPCLNPACAEHARE